MQVPFESILDIDSFSVRIRQADIPHIIQIISAIPKEREDSLRQNVNRVWQRYGRVWGVRESLRGGGKQWLSQKDSVRQNVNHVWQRYGLGVVGE